MGGRPEKPHVLVVTNMWPDGPDRFGSFVAEQVDDLRSAGIEADVLSFDARSSTFRYAEAAMRLRRLVSATSPDVVHAHYGLTGLIAMAQKRAPVVTTFHGSDANVPWQRRLSRVAADRTRAVCVSRGIARLLGRPQADIIPMAVDTDRFRPMAKHEARRALGLQGDRRYVLFPGMPANPIKGHALFEAVLAKLDAEPLVFDGFERSTAPLVLNAADAMLMTSLHEGSPVTVRECLSCGVPVVSVDVGDVAETIGGLPGCSVVERDAEALAAAVESAFQAEALKPLLARAQQTSRGVTTERLIRVYAEVATGEPPAARRRYSAARRPR